MIDLVECDYDYYLELFDYDFKLINPKIYKVVTNIPFLEGSFIIERADGYNIHYILNTLKEHVKNNDIERLKGYVYFKEDIMTLDDPTTNFLKQLSREIKLKEIIED